MTIEHLIDKERWDDARAMLREALSKEPENHWLLTRQSLTYYEQRRYREALKYAERAFAYVPPCPSSSGITRAPCKWLGGMRRRSTCTLAS
jgi:predicted Zn-dependent protease